MTCATWFLLVCRVCGDDLVQPFRTAAERGRFAAEHTAGTGHRVWFCADGDYTPDDVADMIAVHDRVMADLGLARDASPRDMLHAILGRISAGAPDAEAST